MKISVVLGTRPEVIKLAPVILQARKRGHEVQVVLTGQHRDMATPLLRFFGITPDLDLDVMSVNQTLTSLSARILEKLDAQADRLQSDFLIVQGDTTSAFVAAYWGFCRKIRVAHVEAGLRTYDLMAPFPEEANRQLIGRIADVHFAPTKASARALMAEKVAKSKVFQVGNTAIDALKFTLGRLDAAEVPAQERLDPAIPAFVGGAPLVLVTAHRRESFGEKFEDLCRGILTLCEKRPDLRVVYPVHPNPNVRQPVERLLGGNPRILLSNPLPYVAFVTLMKQASLLLTDSGGVQEEAPTLRKPVLVMREKTERPEGVKAGFSKLVGTDTRKIWSESLKALKKGCSGRGTNPYGDGKASERVIRALEKTQ